MIDEHEDIQEIEAAPETAFEQPATSAPPDWAQAIYSEIQDLKSSQAPAWEEDQESWKFDNEKMYQKLRADLTAGQQAIYEETIEKPRLIETAIQEFAGDHPVAAQVIRKQLQGLSRGNIEAALTNRDTREALELLAEGARSRGPRSTAAPRSEGISNPLHNHGLSAEEMREADRMHRAYSETFGEGYTREMAIAAVKRAKGQVR
jgi:hypothetical protein